MSNDELNRAQAEDDCNQLLHSERGRNALIALQAMLAADATYSLDAGNRFALARLLQCALYTPSVREIIAGKLGIHTW